MGRGAGSVRRMNLLNPLPKGMNTVVGGWTQLIGGLFLALAQLFQMVTDCLNGALSLSACIDSLPPLVVAVAVAGNGLAQLGLGSKVEEVKEATL